jgi:hypothetical protein
LIKWMHGKRQQYVATVAVQLPLTASTTGTAGSLFFPPPHACMALYPCNQPKPSCPGMVHRACISSMEISVCQGCVSACCCPAQHQRVQVVYPVLCASSGRPTTLTINLSHHWCQSSQPQSTTHKASCRQSEGWISCLNSAGQSVMQMQMNIIIPHPQPLYPFCCPLSAKGSKQT